jgi:hypothetical protein
MNLPLLYSNRSQEDQEFIKMVCNDILYQECIDKPYDDSFAFLFTDGRNRTVNCLEDFAMIKSTKIYSKFNYPVFCFLANPEGFLEGCSDDTYKLLRDWRIKVIKINPINSLEEYSHFMKNEVFFKIPKQFENIITISPDSGLIKSGWEEFLIQGNWSFIGAPFLHRPAIEYNHYEFDSDYRLQNRGWKDLFGSVYGFNGGFSYRRASFCRMASELCKNLELREKFAENNKKPPEDLMYSIIANKFTKFPTVEEAKKWAVDPMDYEDFENRCSFGFHYFSARNPWKSKKLS